MRQAMQTLMLVLLLLAAAVVVMTFPYLESGRFAELPSINPTLTDRVLSIIDSNSDFPAGKFGIDVSDEVCSWNSAEELRALAAQPGWQLTAGDRSGIWFKKTSFWPWDRHGLALALGPHRVCAATVHRADTI